MKKRKIVTLAVLACIALIALKYIWLNNRDELQDLQKSSDKNSSEVIYYTKESVGSGIPAGDNNASIPALRVSWISGSVVDGSDDCYLYDEESMQIYASSYRSSGFNSEGYSSYGKIYYENNKVTKNDAYGALNTDCFPGIQ
jgi:hypothetical protein